METKVKEQWLALLQECMDNQMYEEGKKCLAMLKNGLTELEFAQQQTKLLQTCGPLIQIVSVECTQEEIEAFISGQSYQNVEILEILDSEDVFADIVDCIQFTNCKYLCFIEKNHKYPSDSLMERVRFLEEHPQLQLVLGKRRVIDSKDTIFAHFDVRFNENNFGKILGGRDFLAYCVKEKSNLYGNLSVVMANTAYLKSLSWQNYHAEYRDIQKTAALYEMIAGTSISIQNTYVAESLIQPKDLSEHENALREAYGHFISRFFQQEMQADESFYTVCAEYRMPLEPKKKKLPASMTFFYQDKGEYFNLKPIGDLAEQMGYQVKYTTDPQEKAVIGVYCQHVCHPENSDFSLILLHDMAQGHNRWPNIWEIEQWNKFDIGIVPGPDWADRWIGASCMDYTRPRCGTFAFGYPKSDLIFDSALADRVEELKQKFQLKYNYSVLYAPSWENDGKEDEFIQALADLPVNLLIKQAHWSATYQNIIDNIEEMRKLHEGKYDNVYYIEPEESIMTALKMCDLIVSEESSVMVEGLMFGKPSIAVTDWLIPDEVPSRMASTPFTCVCKCKKDEIRENVINMKEKGERHFPVDQWKNVMFGNSGNVCQDIMAAIAYYTQDKNVDQTFLTHRLTSESALFSMWN